MERKNIKNKILIALILIFGFNLAFAQDDIVFSNFGRNLSQAEKDFKSEVFVFPGDVIEFKIEIYTKNSLKEVILGNNFSSHLKLIEDSFTIDGKRTRVDLTNISFGDLATGTKKEIVFRAMVTPAETFTSLPYTIFSTATLKGKNFAQKTATVTINVKKPEMATGVPTGVNSPILLALESSLFLSLMLEIKEFTRRKIEEILPENKYWLYYRKTFSEFKLKRMRSKR
jgi:hypothetical protein